MVRLKKLNDKLDFKYKNEFCIDSRDNYIQQMLLFKFQGKLYLALARKAGLIQLYENTVNRRCGGQRSFKLYKEWKHSNMNPLDSMVAIGFFKDQYLYSCSSEGKLIFRDLINDDADESYKVYLIHKPVSCVEIKSVSGNNILVVASGKNNELKLYNVEMKDNEYEMMNHLHNVFRVPAEESGSGSSIDLNYDPVDIGRPILQLRRRSATLNLRSTMNERQIHTLMPYWMSSSSREDYIYYTSPVDIISNWIVSICVMLHDSNVILCGTQFGNLLLYNIDVDTNPLKVMKLSQFSIVNLTLFDDDQFLLYTDSMSKAGVIKLSNFKITNQYENLKIGPMSSCKVVVNKHSYIRRFNQNGCISNFDPVYLICTTIDRRLIIYKLFDDDSYQMVFNLQTNSLIPAINILGQTCDDYQHISALINAGDVSTINHDRATKRRNIYLVPKINLNRHSNVCPMISKDEVKPTDYNDNNERYKENKTKTIVK